ncbi:unnamed protein product [Owenia fusiformis]|uniref:Uncharacterized protein n=1 Tax=Owenia fusiformis TaxID=6347 RepID=A0A8S4NHY1_OWEFU|nr:unnamed protein product [Owenia fusiformis]
MKSKLFIFWIPLTCLTGISLIQPIHSKDDTDWKNVPQFPRYWEKAPASLAEYPKNNNTVYINPWNYLDRQGMYKSIIEATGKQLNGTELGGNLNLIWGLPLQHGWQFETGRLRDFTNRTLCGFGNDTHFDEKSEIFCVSPKSWWASMNYYLSVLPFLAAMDAGYFKDEIKGLKVELKPPNFNADKFCYEIKDCKNKEIKSMKSLSDFFSYLKKCSQTKCETDIAAEKLWKAHVELIDAGTKLFDDELSLLSSAEQRFGKGWVKTVSMLAAIRFRTNMIQTSKFQELGLPKRILWETDAAPNIQDLSQTENMCLYVLDLLLYWDNLSGGSIVSTWNAVMCSEATRKIGRTIMTDLFQSPLSAANDIMSLLWTRITRGC